MLDREGYRPNVGIILVTQKRGFLGQSASGHSRQFRRAGSNVKPLEAAMYQELQEVGLQTGACIASWGELAIGCVLRCASAMD